MGNHPTIEDVARAARVSRQTVSNVLNTPERVRPVTRERVESAITKLGYRPHASARRLRTQKSSTIGIRLDPMSNGISGSVLDSFLHALTEQADQRGMRVLLYTAADPHAEMAQIRKLHDGADVDAFVLTSTFHGDPRTEYLIAGGVPFVTFGRPWGVDDMNDPQHLWVDVDGASGVREATEHLLARGAARVGFLGWPSPSGTGDDRRRGWQSAMAQAPGMDAATLAALTITASDSVTEAQSAVLRAHAAGARWDALVCASDSLALGARMAAASVGLAELPIVGFDNTPVAEAVGLSSVDQRLTEVAAGVLELLMGVSGKAIVPRELTPGESHRLITPRLVVRRGDTGVDLAGAP
ncbi:LacI family DNA-binding transcriptional regulator [Compostimonas suwonensis]|uniref:DNA-binding LacI/PurR family transcriptional regulator n=1 Tax=Compostimonas suwonensis TaxID=1048394 RepID=A0A2M9C4Q3_9MICO|nr:LacI family DNA-binding transcriptional regulator [Compostimonas suwonensis]PJJ65505.1 DNA-binding LacI/PurR family transcriptional regulator [Compostimonas suwonensis]